MRILVTGGAGYIGSVTVRELQKRGFDVVVFDNLAYGHREAVSCTLVVGDLLDKAVIDQGLSGKQFDAVIHFAAYALAGESMKKPYKYFKNNILGGLNLLEWMREKGIRHIIFSSTSAVYGTPKKLPVTENAEKKPESVYGESKLMVEKLLYWYDKIYGIKHISLRYFNAAGASLDGLLGEDHRPETHIIPLAIKTALGQNSQFELYGNDYETPDGTCIRDYIHIEDLAIAHRLALEKLEKSGESDSFNLGTGRGYSNLEVLAMVKKITEVDFPVQVGPRRQGDPPAIYTNNEKAKKELGFTPQHSDLETIVRTAWQWHVKNSKGKSQNSK